MKKWILTSAVNQLKYLIAINYMIFIVNSWLIENEIYIFLFSSKCTLKGYFSSF